MPRAMRKEYPGAIYHVMDRGDRREEADEEEFKPLRRGWCLGSEHFRQEFHERMEGKLDKNHSGELHRETAQQRASRILAEALSRRGGTESDWAIRRHSDPGKVAVAVRRRSATPWPHKWIAARGHLGTAKGAKSVRHRSGHSRRPHKPARADQPCIQLEFQPTVF
jgi:hypothetical protein